MGRQTMRYFESYYITKKITDCAEGVIVGKIALVVNAMSTGLPSNICVATKNEWLDGFDLFRLRYKYIEDLDIENFLFPINGNAKLFIPTAERAIVDALRYPDTLLEEYTLQAIVDYCDMLHKNEDISMLYEVAEFYGISKSEMDSHIEDARDYVYCMV